MIAILVLSLIVCALTVDYLVLLPRRRHATIYVDDTHMWLAPEASGLARVGIDRVASLLVGRPDRIDWAADGPIVRGAPLAVVSGGGHRLTLRSPVDGLVVEHNPSLHGHPSEMVRNPLDTGWLVRLRPSNLAAQLGAMRSGNKLVAWSQDEMARLRAFILARIPGSVAVGATAMDGGELGLEVARHLDQDAFAEAVRMVFADGPATEPAPVQPGSQNAATS